MPDIVATPIHDLWKVEIRGCSWWLEEGKCHTSTWRSWKRTQESMGPLTCLTAAPGKVKERVLLGTAASQLKQMTGNRQHRSRFTKGKSWLTWPLSTTRAVDINYLDANKALHNVYDSLLAKKGRYRVAGWSVRQVGNWPTSYNHNVVINCCSLGRQPVTSQVPWWLILASVLFRR